MRFYRYDNFNRKKNRYLNSEKLYSFIQRCKKSISCFVTLPLITHTRTLIWIYFWNEWCISNAWQRSESKCLTAPDHKKKFTWTKKKLVNKIIISFRKRKVSLQFNQKRGTMLSFLWDSRFEQMLIFIFFF